MTREKATQYLLNKFGPNGAAYIARCEESEGATYWEEFASLDELVADFEYDQDENA
jgi:hypothetical protein